MSFSLRTRPIPTLGISLRAYEDAIAAYGEIIFVYRHPSSVGVKVNERDDAMSVAVFIISMGSWVESRRSFFPFLSSFIDFSSDG